jgi:hypothetical protein
VLGGIMRDIVRAVALPKVVACALQYLAMYPFATAQTDVILSHEYFLFHQHPQNATVASSRAKTGLGFELWVFKTVIF